MDLRLKFLDNVRGFFGAPGNSNPLVAEDELR